MIWLAAGSCLVFCGLVYLLDRESRRSGSSSPLRPLEVYCAAALKPAMQTIAASYESETGQGVNFEFGDSGSMLGKVSVRSGGDLFLPADDSFVQLAREKGLAADTLRLCRMHAVILARPASPITRFDDLLKPGLKVGIANPASAAIGKVVKAHLERLGKWDALAARLAVQHATVTDSANAVQLGSDDAAIVWDVVAVNYPGLAVMRVPELDGAIGRVELAILSGAKDPAGARRLARYIAAADRGMVEFRRIGFAELLPGPPWHSSEAMP
jgi:molybdate transport system substrate-binding protein